jgi:hypothetical protein
MQHSKLNTLAIAKAALIALFVGCTPSILHSAETPAVTDEHAQTEAAVLAIEDHWLRAEVTGDTAFLSFFLLPQYRSVNEDGSAHPRDAIIAHAAKNRGSTKAIDELHEYRQSHPAETSVVLLGDLAIVSFYDPRLGVQQGVRSSDILMYRDGVWHAVYSQHSRLT